MRSAVPLRHQATHARSSTARSLSEVHRRKRNWAACKGERFLGFFWESSWIFPTGLLTRGGVADEGGSCIDPKFERQARSCCYGTCTRALISDSATGKANCASAPGLPVEGGIEMLNCRLRGPPLGGGLKGASLGGLRVPPRLTGKFYIKRKPSARTARWHQNFWLTRGGTWFFLQVKFTD